MESLSLLLLLLLLIIIIIPLAACVYCTLASAQKRTAEEEQLRKSCQAKAAEQAKADRAQIKALQTKHDSEVRAHGSLMREMRKLESIHEAHIIKAHSQKRESDRGLNDLRDKLREAAFDTSTVENAAYVKQQWISISGTLAKAGFVAKTPEDLARSIEKLLELQSSATALYNQATLDKQELANEKAAKEAALAEAEALSNSLEKVKIDAKILKIDLEGMKATAEANLEFNSHHHEQLGNEAARKLKKQLKKAHEATTEADGKLREAENTIRQKDCQIAALNEQKDAEIAALRAELEKAPKTNEATASTTLQQELSQTKTELATANKTIEYLGNEGHALLVEGQTLAEKYNVLSADFNALIQTAREHEEYANGAKMHMRRMLASFRKKSKTRLSAHQLRLKGQKGKIAQLKKKAAEHDQHFTRLPSDLANATKEIADRDQKITELSSDLANATKEIADRDQNITELSSDLANATKEIADRDQNITEFSSKLASANEAIAKRDEQVTRLSSDLVDANKQLLSAWDASNTGFPDSNHNSGTYDSGNGMANGFDFDPQSSLSAQTSYGNDMTIQDTSYDFTTRGPQAGTDFIFDDGLFDGSIDNGGLANSMDLDNANTSGGSNNDGGSGSIPTLSGANNDGSLSDPTNDWDWSKLVHWDGPNAQSGSNNDEVLHDFS